RAVHRTRPPSSSRGGRGRAHRDRPWTPFGGMIPERGSRNGGGRAELVRLVRRSIVLIVALSALGAAPAVHAAVNPQIAGLQVALRAHGLYLAQIDGLAGPQTAAAVGAFQRKHGLPQGPAGARLRAAPGP